MVRVYLAAIIVQMMLAAGQVSLKVFAGRLSASGWSLPPNLAAATHIAVPALVAGLIYVTAAALWIYVLQNLPVNRAFLFVALAFVFVPIVSHFLLGERIDVGVYVGTAFIVTGIVLGTLL